MVECTIVEAVMEPLLAVTACLKNWNKKAHITRKPPPCMMGGFPQHEVVQTTALWLITKVRENIKCNRHWRMANAIVCGDRIG